MTYQCFKLMRDFCCTWPQSCWKEKSVSFHCFQKTKMRHLSHQYQLLQCPTTCLVATRHFIIISMSAFSKMSQMFLVVHQTLSKNFFRKFLWKIPFWTDNCCHNCFFCLSYSTNIKENNINIKYVYRTSAIISRGLCTFLPHFKGHLCTATLGLMYALYSRAASNQ